jgi:hypothetical protein
MTHECPPRSNGCDKQAGNAPDLAAFPGFAGPSGTCKTEMGMGKPEFKRQNEKPQSPAEFSMNG